MSLKVIFFGSIGIAKKILEEIILTKDIDLLGVCCEKNINAWRDEESVYGFAQKRHIPILALEDIPFLKPDLGISVRFNKIIKDSVIDSFRLGIVNTHGGILPEYRGSYCNINAIINGESEYGVTLHYIQPGVDDGDIVDIKKIRISDDCTGLDLYHESEQLCYDIISENMDKLLAGTNRRIPQQEYIDNGHVCQTYRRDDTLNRKDLTKVDMRDQLWLRTVRAFDSPFHEPAYIRVGDQIVYIRYRYGVQ